MIILIINSNNFFLMMMYWHCKGKIAVAHFWDQIPCMTTHNSQLTITLKKCQGTIACYLNRSMMILNSYISQFWVKNSLPES